MSDNNKVFLQYDFQNRSEIATFLTADFRFLGRSRIHGGRRASSSL